MLRNPAFSALAMLSLALGIGANTAIYSFMDSILLRSLPVSGPGVAGRPELAQRTRQLRRPGRIRFVLHSIDGSIVSRCRRHLGRIFPYPAFERLQQLAAPVFSSLFAYYPAGTLNVMVKGQAELAEGDYVSGDYFRGLAVSPAAGRPSARRRSRGRDAGRGPQLADTASVASATRRARSASRS